jgi:hypothetical protein
MNEVYIRTWVLPEWLKEKYFKNQAFYSIDELIGIIEDLDADVERLEEELEDFKRDRDDNYKLMTTEEQIGWSHNW